MIYEAEELRHWPAYVTPRLRTRLCRIVAINLHTLTNQKWSATSRQHTSAIGLKLHITCKSATDAKALEFSWGDLRLAWLLHDEPLGIGEHDALTMAARCRILHAIYLTTPHGKRLASFLRRLEAGELEEGE